LLGLLGDLQDAGAVAVLLDDVHWADLPTLNAVTFALRRLRADRVLSLMTVRSEQSQRIPAGVERLIEGGRGCRINLEGLTFAELGALIRVRDLPPLSPVRLRQLWSHTGGNPLWAAALLEELPREHLGASDRRLPAPESLARLMRRRFDGCSPSAQSLVAAAAVTGTATDLGALGRLVGSPRPFDALDEAVKAGLLERHGSPPTVSVAFAHPVVAAAVYDGLEMAPRAALHRRAAELAGDDVTRIRHEVAASCGSDATLSKRVAEHARRQRQRGALATAASAFVQAARLSPERATDDDLLLDAVETHLMAGEVAHADSLLKQYPDIAPGRRLDYIKGWTDFATGRLDRARILLVRAWGHGNDELAGAAAFTLTDLELVTGRGLAAASWGQRAVQLATAGWHRKTAAGRQALGLFIAGRPVDAFAALDWLSDIDELRPDELDAASMRAILRLFDDDLDKARQECRSILSASRSTGDFLLGSHVLGHLAEVQYRTGHWDDAVDLAERALSAVIDLDQFWVLPSAHAVATPVYARRGDWRLAAHHVEAATSAAGS
jgi:thioredoxin-like negative regulator of GroEL